MKLWYNTKKQGKDMMTVKVGDIVEIKHETPNGTVLVKGVVNSAVVTDYLNSVWVELPRREDLDTMTHNIVSVPLTKLTVTRPSNLVMTTITFANKQSTTKVIDLNNANEKIKFAKIAAQCYCGNGTVTAVGVNEKVGECEGW